MDEEQRDCRLSSHINLIDLAGSECCSTAQTTGERLKVNQDWERIDCKASSPPRTAVIEGYAALILISIAQHFAGEGGWP